MADNESQPTLLIDYDKEDDNFGYGVFKYEFSSNQKYESLKLKFGADSSIVMTSIAINYSTPALNFKTRIPFCELDDEGNPTDVFDEFWDLNLNYLNPNYPAYPDNTPTYKIYDEEFCPCLHKTQNYIDNTGETISYPLNWLTAGETANTFNGMVRTYFQFLHDKLPDTLTTHVIDKQQSVNYYRYKQTEINVDGSIDDVVEDYGDYTFIPAIGNILVKNGHIPAFGFIGIGQLQPLPSLFQLGLSEVDDSFFSVRRIPWFFKRRAV